MAFTEQYKTKRIEDIVDSAENYDYHDFVANCVRQTVSQWSDEEIVNWFGPKQDTECKILDSVDCYRGECEHIESS